MHRGRGWKSSPIEMTRPRKGSQMLVYEPMGLGDTHNCFYYLNEIGNVLLSAGNKDGEDKGRTVNQLSSPGGEGTGGLLVVPRAAG